MTSKPEQPAKSKAAKTLASNGTTPAQRSRAAKTLATDSPSTAKSAPKSAAAKKSPSTGKQTPSETSKSRAAKAMASNGTSAAQRSQAAKVLGTAGGQSRSASNAKPASTPKPPKAPKPAQPKSGDGRGRVTAQAAQQTSQAQLNKFKMEAARELGIPLGQGKMSRQQAGQIGGQVVKKMVAAYEKGQK